MQNSKMKKIVSVLLVFCILISCAPFIYALDLSGLFAGEEAELIELDESCKILNYIDAETFRLGKHVGRLKSQERLDTYVFQNRDGTRTVYYMGGPVKYRDENGTVREKDLTLVEKTGGYGVAASDLDMLLPGNPDMGIDVSYGELTITIVPEKVSFAAKAGTVDGDSYVYADCFGNGIDLVYTPTLDGVKEDIVIERYFGKNQFSFLIESNGLRMFSKDGRYYLAGGENADDKLWLGDLLIYDAMGKPGTGTMDVATVEEGKTYRVTLTADEKFLTDAETVFPVTVDPTVQVTISEANGTGLIEDATVFVNKPTVNANWTYNHVGLYDSNYGVGMTVYRLTGLLADSGYAAATADQVTSVLFYVKEASGTPTQTLNLYAMNNASWTETGVTYNNYGEYDWNTLYASAELKPNEPGVFDITDLAKAWKNGTRNAYSGFILVNSNTNSTAAEKTLYSCEHGNTDSRPYVIATYESGLSMNTSSLELDEGSTYTLSLTSGTAASWSSSNTSVATVSNGVVTGVKAGTATITATNPNGLTVSCAVMVKKPGGIYRIDHVTTGLKMGMGSVDQGVQKLVIAQNIGSTVYETYGQQWILHHVGNGYYTVSPSYAQNGNLYMNADQSLTVEALTGYAAQWEVYYQQTGYILQNRYYGKFLYLSSTASAQSNIGISSASSSSVRWNLYAGSSPTGIAVYDTDTFSWINPSEDAILSVGAKLKPVCMNSASHSGNYSSNNSEVLSYSSVSREFTIIDGGKKSITISHTCSTSSISFTLCAYLPLSGSEVEYEPELWNTNNADCWQNTNCYAYALNRQTNDPSAIGAIGVGAQPGEFSDSTIAIRFTIAAIKSAILADGEALGKSISIVGKNDTCESGTYKVALFVDKDGETGYCTEYHFYRQNPDGTWSHKAPKVNATNIDASGNVIWDPEDINADYTNSGRGDYEFECYFAVEPSNIMLVTD